MSKHTPGPFTYKDGWVIKREEGKDDCRIAEVRGWGWLIHKHIHADKTSNHDAAAIEQDANGLILSAAPELLEALETLVNRRDEACEAHGIHRKDGSDGRYEKARAAIAKAKGTK